MRRFPHLMKSRHGVYYVRLVAPVELRRRIPSTPREVRKSLGTKDKARAHVLFCKTYLRMRHALDEQFPWEVEADREKELFHKGLKLMEQFNNLDPNDQFALDTLSDELSVEQLECYQFAFAHIEEQKRQTAERIAIPKIQNGIEPNLRDTASRSDLEVPLNDAILTDAIELFVQSKQNSSTRKATAEKYGAQCSLFAKIVSEGSTSFHVSDISVVAMRRYVEVLPKLPTRTRILDKRLIAQILASNGPRMSIKTIFSHAQAVQMLLQWLHDQQYPLEPNLQSILKPVLIKKSDGKRAPFHADDIQKMFATVEYSDGSFKLPAHYWVPLLALYTGARQAELCQLHTTDITKDEGANIWIIDINETDDKRVKTEKTVRRVPVHTDLIKLGFLQFVNDKALRNEKRLFPELKRSNDEEFGAFSKWFGRYRKQKGIITSAKARKDFHSFRHFLVSQLLSGGEEEYVVNEIVGHDRSKSSESVKTYFTQLTIQTKYKALSKFRTGLNLDLIKENGWKSSLISNFQK